MFHWAVNLMTLVPRSAAGLWHVFDGAPEKQAVAGGVDPGLWGSQRSPHPAEHGLYSLCVVAAFLEKPAYIKREREKLGFLKNYYYFFNVYLFLRERERHTHTLRAGEGQTKPRVGRLTE